MTQKNLFVLMAIITLAFATRAAEQENPFKTAKVGDENEYKISSGPMSGTMKQTLIKKTDTEATLEIVTNMAGHEAKHQQVIKFDEKYDLQKMMVPMPDAEVKIANSGEEKLTIADKTYNTKWTETEITMKIADQEIKTKGKIWQSSEVPLSGMVKVVTETAGNTMTMELISCKKGQ